MSTPDSGTNTTLAQAIATTPVGVQLTGNIPDEAHISLDIEGDFDSPVAPSPAPTPDPAPAPEPSTTAPAPEPKAEPTFEVPTDDDLAPEPAPAPEPPVQPNIQQPAQLPPQRDYSAYPAELHPVLRQLNNKAFAEYAPRLKAAFEAQTKAAELETRVSQQPKFFYEHPEAYRLDPQFNQLNNTLREVQFEEQHWSRQLANIKQGKPWQNLKGYDTKTGQPVFESVNPPDDGTVDANAEIEVFKLLNETQHAKSAYGQQLQNYSLQYKTQTQRAQAELDEIKTKLFPSLKPETLAGVDKDNYELAASITPEALRNHPLAQLNQLAFVAYHRLQRAYANIAAENKKLKSGVRPVPATPSPSAVQGGAPTGDDVMIPIELDDL